MQILPLSTHPFTPPTDRDMLASERRAFVRTHRTCVFGTNRRDDGPAMSIVYYVPTDSDELLVSTMRDRSKAKVVARQRKASLCVLSEQWPFSYLQVYCDATVDDDPRLVVDVMMAAAGPAKRSQKTPGRSCRRWPRRRIASSCAARRTKRSPNPRATYTGTTKPRRSRTGFPRRCRGVRATEPLAGLVGLRRIGLLPTPRRFHPGGRPNIWRHDEQATSEELLMTKPKSPSKLIDERIKELPDWRGKVLSRVRLLIKQAEPGVVEEWKWRGVPTWEHDGIICTGETYKDKVKLTFAKGASLKDPARLFNSSLEGNVRRAIDIFEGDKLDEKAFKSLVRAAADLNESKARR